MNVHINVQQVIVLLIVSGAALFVARRAWRTMRKVKPVAGAGCEDCGCSPATTRSTK